MNTVWKITVCMVLSLLTLGSAFFAQAENGDALVNRYVFYVEGREYRTAILASGDCLYPPENPVKDDHRFSGWYADEACAVPFDGFSASITPDGSTTPLYAKFDRVYYVTYYDLNHTVLLTVEVAAGESHTFSPNDPLFYPGLAGQNIAWQDGAGTRYNGATAITQNLDVYPVLQEGFFIRFDTQGGSFIPSQFVELGQLVAQPSSDPVRQGYTFKGWYDAASGGSLFDFDTPPRAGETIWAQWEAQPVYYTVAYWCENPDDTGYHFVESVQRQAYPGDTVDQSVLEGLNLLQSNKYKHFCFDHTDECVVAADGSSIVHVYYRAYIITLVITGKTQTGEDRQYTLYTKFQQNTKSIRDAIADIHYDDDLTSFQVTYATPTWDPRWGLQFTTDQFVTSIITGKQDQTFYLQQGMFEKIQTYRYYCYELTGTESPAGPIAPGINDGRQFYVAYTKHVENSGPVVTNTGLPVGYTPYWFVDANGFEFDLRNLTPNTNASMQLSYAGKNYMYYTKNQHNIIFHTNGGPEIAPVEDVYYNDVLTAYEPAAYVVDTTQEVVGNVPCVFRGWYSEETLHIPVDFAQDRMPDNNLMLYAKWEPITAAVTFDPNGGSLQGEGTVSLRIGQQAAQPADPTRDVPWVFLGWALEGKPYDFSSPVVKDITLVAQWRDGAVYTVTYDPGAGSGAVTDKKKYAFGSSAVVLEGNGLTPPSEQHFVWWQDGQGRLYRPGQTLSIASDVTLTAVYLPWTDHRFIITFDPNGGLLGGRGEPVTSAHAYQETISIREAPIRSGYTFLYWKGSEYRPGDSYTVKGDHTFVAQWKQDDPRYPFTFTKVWQGEADGTAQFTLYRKDGTAYKTYTARDMTKNGNTWVKTVYLRQPADYYVLEGKTPGYQMKYENKDASVTDRCLNGGVIINTPIPQTGDSAPLLLWISLCTLGAVGLALCLKKRAPKS